MKKNTVALAVAAAMTASLLVGCGGTAADSTSTAESTATSTDAASAATTTAGGDETLTVWAWDPNFNIYALKQQSLMSTIRPLISTAVRLFTRTSLISQARFPLMIAALIIPISAAL